MDAEIKIRPAVPGDVAFMAGAHAMVFRGLVSARLGAAYLESFYGRLVAGPGTACFIAQRFGEKDGFICGAGSPSSGSLSFFEQSLSAGLALARGNIKPGELPDLFRYRRWAAGARLPAELVSLAVLPVNRGSGAGRLLVKALEDHFLATGINEFCVFTDTLVSTGLPFYLKLGFEQAGEYGHGGNYKSICLRRRIK